MTKPLISLIIATYNSGGFLTYCLDSIESQSFKGFELIIIDGNSTDQTVDILKKYDKSINYWISEKDSGIYDAWNKGIAQAKGTWITFLGSDDALYPTAFDDYVNFLSTIDKDVKYVSSKLNLTDGDRNVIKTLGLPWDWKTCRLQNVIAHPGSLHHRELYEKYGLYDTSYKICADFEFLLRPGKYLKSAFMDKITVKMQQGGVSTQAASVFIEHHRAALSTGELNPFLASFFLNYQFFKFRIKSFIRKMGMKI
jgi:glycosyltransferase involved in cell wall biosynthesis